MHSNGCGSIYLVALSKICLATSVFPLPVGPKKQIFMCYPLKVIEDNMQKHMC